MTEDKTSTFESDDSADASQKAVSLTPEVPCPYLPGLTSRSEAYQASELRAHDYESLMSFGFRRSGHIVYRPSCKNCTACQPIRVVVEKFKPTRSMQRIARKNADLSIKVATPQPTDQKHEIFQRYLDHQHDGTMSRSREDFVSFLYDSPCDTLEATYYAGDRILGVSILDACPTGMSSVYMFFDPEDAHRSLGTFSILREIEYCRENRLSYYYLGYYVAGSKTMEYKSRFRENQVLVGDARWATFRE